MKLPQGPFQQLERLEKTHLQQLLHESVERGLLLAEAWQQHLSQQKPYDAETAELPRDIIGATLHTSLSPTQILPRTCPLPP